MKRSSIPNNPDYIPSYSFLKSMAEENDGNPMKAIWKRENREPITDAQKFGNLIEDALLTDDLKSKYCVYDLKARPEPNKTMAARANKEWLGLFKLSCMENNVLAIPLDWWEACLQVKERVYNDPRWKQFNDGETQRELIGAINGMKMRGFADKGRMGVIGLDIKTVGSASRKGFWTQARKLFWDVQAVKYMIASGCNTWYFLAIETKPPYCHEFHYMIRDSDTFRKAEYLLEKWLINFYRCKRENLWHMGYEFHSHPEYGAEIENSRYIPELVIL